jgi:hypothetical protein
MSAPHITDDELRRFLATFYRVAEMRDAARREAMVDDFFRTSGHYLLQALEEFVAHRAMRDRTQALRAQYAAAEETNSAA